MKRSNEFPPGWNEQRVRELAEYYEHQSDEDAVAEHEAALSRPNHTLMPIPRELVPQVHELLAQHEAKRAS